MDENSKHIFVTDGEEPLTYKVDETGLMLDLKFLLKEYYAACFTQDGNALEIAFSNGQKFKICITEVEQ